MDDDNVPKNGLLGFHLVRSVCLILWWKPFQKNGQLLNWNLFLVLRWGSKSPLEFERDVYTTAILSYYICILWLVMDFYLYSVTIPSKTWSFQHLPISHVSLGEHPIRAHTHFYGAKLETALLAIIWGHDGFVHLEVQLPAGIASLSF